MATHYVPTDKFAEFEDRLFKGDQTVEQLLTEYQKYNKSNTSGLNIHLLDHPSIYSSINQSIDPSSQSRYLNTKESLLIYIYIYIASEIVEYNKIITNCFSKESVEAIIAQLEKVRLDYCIIVSTVCFILFPKFALLADELISISIHPFILLLCRKVNLLRIAIKSKDGPSK